MGFADLSKKLKSAAQSTIEKSKDLAEITKCNVAITSFEDEIALAKKEVGQYVVENDLLHEVPEIAAFYEKIEKALVQIEENKLKIEAIKANTICQSCGAEVDASVKFCPVCGAAKANLVAASEEAVAAKLCPSCNSAVDAGADFCSECGQKM